MKPATIIGVILIIVGVVCFALGGVSFSHQKKDVDMGPVQVSHEQQKTMLLPPALGAIVLVGGIGLTLVGLRQRYSPAPYLTQSRKK